jgi:hypothetical protein
MSLAIDLVGLSQLLAAAVVGSRTRCVRGDTESCDRLASLARWVQQEDERTSDDALQWAGRVRPDQGKPISRIPAPTAGATDLLSRLSEYYAKQIARDWNTKDERSGFVGFVLRFNVKGELSS